MLKVDYHPSLVWMEIMSFLKGSYMALTSERGYLDLDTYHQVGRKEAPNFTGDRQKVRMSGWNVGKQIQLKMIIVMPKICNERI